VNWQPDSKGLIYLEHVTFHYVPIPGGEPQIITEASSYDPDYKIFWRGDSKGFFLFFQKEHKLFFYNTTTNELRLVDDTLGQYADDITWVTNAK
jgi:hypothetical protein